MNTASHNVATIAELIVAHSVAIGHIEGAKWDIIITGIMGDEDITHFYMNKNGGPAVDAIQKTAGSYIGTRYRDGSATVASGHSRLPVVFNGLFYGEKAPKGWDEVQA